MFHFHSETVKLPTLDVLRSIQNFLLFSGMSGLNLEKMLSFLFGEFPLELMLATGFSTPSFVTLDVRKLSSMSTH